VRSVDLKGDDQMTPGASVGGLPLSARPDDDDVAFYAEHGWWISPKVFSDDFIDAAVDAAERFYRARGRTLPFQDGYSNWTEDDGFDVVRNNEFVSLQSDDLRAVACQPVLGAMTAVGWHADHADWGTCSSERLRRRGSVPRRRRRERNARGARREAIAAEASWAKTYCFAQKTPRRLESLQKSLRVCVMA